MHTFIITQGVKMSGLICSCGKEKFSIRKKFCEECRIKSKRETARLNAQLFRKRHGSVVKRSIYCSMCKFIKEHQERGYCLACERERYKEKSKPDCATCGKNKENPRDAYCNFCKREKNREKSFKEGKRDRNSPGLGRKKTCSICGKLKEENYINESCCRDCKVMRKKLSRSSRTDDQILKENVRRYTYKAIMEGVLIRQPCEVCNTEIDVQAHHDDYYKPLEVRWLCRKHHREHHLNER